MFTCRLNLAYVIWWWQFSWSDGLILLFITRSGWSVKMRSIQDDEFWRMCIDSHINLEKPYSELIDSICLPSLFVMSWTHQLLELALKSPSRIVKAGSLLLILHKRFSRDRRKCSNSLWFWLGEQYKVITYPSFFLMTMFAFILLIDLQKPYHCNRCIHLLIWYYWDDLLVLWSILQRTMHCHLLKLKNQDGLPIYREYQICELH